MLIMNMDQYIPSIYKDETRSAMLEVNASLKNRDAQAPESDILKSVTKLGVFIASFKYLKQCTVGYWYTRRAITVLEAAVPSFALTLIAEELFHTVKLAKKISCINEDLEKVNKLESQIKLAKKEFEGKDKEELDNEEAIEEHIRKVEKIASDAKEIHSNAKHKAICNLALRITAVTALAIGLVASLVLANPVLKVFSKPIFMIDKRLYILTKPAMLAASVVYLITRLFIDDSTPTKQTIKAINKVDSKVDHMLELMDCAKTIADGETGHYKPRFDDLEANIKYYEDLYEIQKENENTPLFNGDLDDSYTIIDDNIKYYTRELDKKFATV